MGYEQHTPARAPEEITLHILRRVNPNTRHSTIAKRRQLKRYFTITFHNT